MNHRTISVLLLALLFAACNNDKREDKKATPRNFAITKKNAYSNLFFDSAQLVKYLVGQKASDSVIQRMISFYNGRNYQFAWFASDGATEEAIYFWNMYSYYLSHEKDKATEDKKLRSLMDKVLSADEHGAQKISQSQLMTVEFKLTDHFLRFFLNNTEQNLLRRKALERFIPAVKMDVNHLADSIINKKNTDDRYFEETNSKYKLLKQHLKDYVNISNNGGWPKITTNAKVLNKHRSSTQISALKKRLGMIEDYNTMDSSQVWNDELTNAVKRFQQLYGFTADGKLTDEQIKQMNVPVEYRIKQLLINLNRMRLAVPQPEGKFIYVNIPEYQLHVTDRGKKVFDMPVVVGKQGNNTKVFAGNMSQVVFAPHWNIPENIIREEIEPELENNPNYLEEHNMELNGNLPDGSPAIRQKPGGDNALGKVKFIFPNSFDIYFHDTPAKSFFEKDKRAYSHGCVRLSDPVRLAKYVLQDQKKWDDEAINKALDDTTEKFVSLKNEIPVLITYYTAWTDENGMLHFAEDIYGHDRVLASKLFFN